MRYLIDTFLIVVILNLIVGCGNKTNVDNKHIQDSIAQVEKRNRHVQDSIIYEKSLIAWGKIKFGTSKADVSKNKIMKDCSVGDNEISMGFDVLDDISNTFSLSNLYSFNAYFEEDELTSIVLKSYSVTADHIDDLVLDCNTLANIFQKKMGTPIMRDDNISILDFNEGYEFKFAQYKVGSKNVLIRLGEENSGGEFYYIVTISNSAFPKKKHIPTKEEIKAQKDAEAKQKDVQNNSF